MPYLWTDITLKSCGVNAYGYLKIEMAPQTITRTTPYAQDRPGYGALDFTTGVTTVTEKTWIDIPDFDMLKEPEMGAMGAANGTFRANNVVVDTGTGDRFSDILFRSDPLTTLWHIRLSYKPAGGSYLYFWQGFIPPDELSIEIVDKDDESTWTIEFPAVDLIQLLDDVSVNLAWFSQRLPLGTVDLTASNGINICWRDGATPNVHTLDVLDLFTDDSDEVFAAGIWVKWTSPASQFRFIKIATIVQACSDSINVTEDFLSTLEHSWDFNYYNGSADVPVGFEDLCIPAALWYSGLSLWVQQSGYFDATGKSARSFYNCGSALELLKACLIPFGLVAQILPTPDTGVLFLKVQEPHTDFEETLTSWYTPAKLKPSRRALYGFKVSTKCNRDYFIGTSGDGAVAIENYFTSANGIPNCFQWSHDPGGVEPGRCDDYFAALGAVYAWDATNTKVWSIYKIDVKDAGTAAANGYGTGLTFVYNDYRANLLFAAAAAAFYNAQGYPSTGASGSRVGIYRRYGLRLEIDVPGLLVRSAFPGYWFEWDSKIWWIVGRKVSFKSGKTTLILEGSDK